jgi:dCMP deaminase
MSRWAEFLMKHARLAATQSKDSTQVGAALVAPDGRTVILTAYNGPPAGVEDREERRVRPHKYLWAAHAEANLIAKAARHGIRTDECVVYSSHAPCAACARTLISAGVRQVVCDGGVTHMDPAEVEAADTMFAEAGVRRLRLVEGRVVS